MAKVDLSEILRLPLDERIDVIAEKRIREQFEAVKVVLRWAAERDMAEAARWYEQQRIGLGDEFMDAAKQAQERIRAYPLLIRTSEVASEGSSFRASRTGSSTSTNPIAS